MVVVNAPILARFTRLVVVEDAEEGIVTTARRHECLLRAADLRLWGTLSSIST